MGGYDLSNQSVLKELGLRIARYRLNKNMTQEALAVESGVSKPTIQRAESGSSIQVLKLISILRALNLIQNIENLIPDSPVSPLQQLKMKGKIRQRASSSHKKNDETDWSWGDKE